MCFVLFAVCLFAVYACFYNAIVCHAINKMQLTYLLTNIATYLLTQDRMWRKTRSRVANGRNLGCVGVDANRNFDFHWQCKFDVSSFSPGKTTKVKQR